MLELSTAGVTLQYAEEVTADTRPITGYALMPSVKSMPDLDPAPANLDVTDLSETTWKRYIEGLRDPGGALQFKANNTNAFQTTWAEHVGQAETAKAAGKAMWYAIVIPGLDNAFYFSGMKLQHTSEVAIHLVFCP